MSKKIFYGILLTALLALTIGLGLVLFILYRHTDEQLTEEMKNRTTILAQGVDDFGLEYLYHLQLQDRITVVEEDGTVCFDNQVDAALMENHGDREEVVQAFAAGSGVSVRYSKTLSEKTCYYAQKLQDGQVLRMSVKQDTVWKMLQYAALPMLFVYLLLAVGALFLSHTIAARIVKPLNQMNLQQPEPAGCYEELAPMVRRLKQQNAKIDRQMQELRQKQQEFQVLTNHMSEGLLIVNREGRIMTSNRSLCSLFQIPVGQTDGNAAVFARNDEIAELLAEVLRGNHRTKVCVIDERFVEVIANPVFEQEDQLAGAVLLFVDVTEREERERLRQEFTANVSHELKTPLTSIYGVSDMLMNGMVLPEDVKGFAEDIHKEAGRLIELVADILKLSKLDAGTIQEEKQEVSVRHMAEEVTDNLARAAKEKEVALTVSGDPGMLSVYETIFYEMLYNLCDNAIKYNRPGGRVSIAVSEQEDEVSVSVTDNGIGIPKEAQERVFERFYRVDQSHSHKNGGTGLGLSIVRHAAICHNGTVALQSEEGRGTCITVYLPKHEDSNSTESES